MISLITLTDWIPKWLPKVYFDGEFVGFYAGNVWLKLVGLYLMADGICSIAHYPDQSWLKEHSIRIFRIIAGLWIFVFA